MKKLCHLCFVLFLCGCVTTVPAPPNETHSERVFDKSYVIGKEHEAFVGDSMVKLKDYLLVTTSQEALAPTKPFTVNIRSTKGEFAQGETYPVITYVKHDGEQLRLIRLKNTSEGVMLGSHAIAIRADGSISPACYIMGNFGWQSGLFDAVASPSDAKMENVVKKAVDQTALFENFELIYNGTDGKSVFLTYREFTPDNLARPAYFQNLTYDLKAGTIRFKKYKISLLAANAERIKFVVLEDGR